MLSVMSGTDPASINPALRLDLQQVNGNTLLNLAQLVGKQVVAGENTSSADVILRALLYAATLGPFNSRPECFTANEVWTPDSPFVFTRLAATNLWPSAAMTVAAAAWAAGDIVGRVTDLATFLSIWKGRQAADAGWEPRHWGVADGDGVAIVPYKRGYCADPDVNTAWASCHMEYPFGNYVITGELQTAGGVQIKDDVGAEVVTTWARVPGAGTKVLFVDCDSQLAGGAGSIQVGESATPTIVTLTLAVNTVLVGGADANLGTAFLNWFDNPNVARVGVIGAIDRWVTDVGSYDDWYSAFAAASVAYSVIPLPPRRVQDTGELARWYNAAGDPFTSDFHTRPSPFEAGTSLWATLTYPDWTRPTTRVMTDAAYNYRYADWEIGTHEPVTYVGIFAGAYAPTHVLDGTVNDMSLTDLCARMCEASDGFGVAADHLASGLGLGEYNMMALGSFVAGGDARQLFGYFERNWVKNLDDVITYCNYQPTWYSQYEANTYYKGLAPVSLLSAGPSRYCEVLKEKWMDYMVVPRDDYCSLTKFGFVARTNELTQVALVYDVLEDWKPQQLQKEELERLARTALTIGSFSFAATTDITNYIICDLQGGNAAYVAVQFENPTVGRGYTTMYANFLAGVRNCDVREVLHSVIPVRIDAELGKREMHLALTAGRDITASTGIVAPLMVRRGPAARITGAPFQDADSVGEMSFLDIFRG
jgi:hypothetical protein